MKTQILYITTLLIHLTTQKTYKFEAIKKTHTSLSPKSHGKDLSTASPHLLTILDSPGQWLQKGINPLTYAKALSNTISTLLTSAQEKYTMYPKALLMQSSKQTLEKGSTSAALITIDNHNGVLRGVNIGSSEYIIYRRKKTRGGKFRYTPRLSGEAVMESFNVPRQVGGEVGMGEESVERELKIHGGELVVVFSDGVAANVFGYKIMQIVNSAVRKNPGDVVGIAERILEKALEASLDGEKDTPFAQKARKNGIEFHGGRVDDISVIVAEVVEDED